MKKHAFTLAETLITLTIIGVVAAMTIPTLMTKHQQKELESQFKKVYSVLNQAITLNTDLRCHLDLMSTRDYVFKDCVPTFWDRVFKEQLKTVKIETAPNPLPYKAASQVTDEGGYHVSACGDYITHTGHISKHYIADGSVIYVNSTYSSSSQETLHIVLDINGDKGPNKWGYDVFKLTPTLMSNGALVFTDSMCPIFEKGGKRPKNILTGAEEVSTNRYDMRY